MVSRTQQRWVRLSRAGRAEGLEFGGVELKAAGGGEEAREAADTSLPPGQA